MKPCVRYTLFFCFLLVATGSLWAAEINEIRFQFTETSGRYIELSGTAGESLDNRALIIIGSNSFYTPTADQGLVRDVIPLSGHYFDDSSDFFTVGILPFGADADLAHDNLTFGAGGSTLMIVQEFTGFLGQDLDTNDDGVLDLTPWAAVDHEIGYRSFSSQNFIYVPTFATSYYNDMFFRPNNSGNLFQLYCGISFNADYDTPGESNPGPNPGPTNIFSTPSPIVVSESAPNYFTFARFDMSDDFPTSFFLLLDDAGGRFRQRYTLSNQLQVTDNSLLDAATSPTHQVEIRGIDCHGNTLDRTFTIYVEAANSELLLPIEGGDTPELVYPGAGFGVRVNENADPDGFALTGQHLTNFAEGNIAPGASAQAGDGSMVSPDVVATTQAWRLEASNLTGSVSYQLSLNADDLLGVSDPNRLLILHRANPSEEWTPINTSYAAGKLSSSDLNTFGEFAIGSDSTINPLPVAASEFVLE